MHMHPPHIDLDDPKYETRSWHWLRERVLSFLDQPPTT